MYTVYNYGSIVKSNFRGESGHKKKGSAAARAHALINKFKEMWGRTVYDLVNWNG